MNTMRMGLLCALVGWMAADAQAQWGTYGSPDPIPLGQAAPRDSYAPAAISRASYVAAADGSGPVIPPPPSAALPQPPMSAPGGVPQLPTPTPGNVPQPSMPGPRMVPQPATESNAVMSILNEPGPAFNPAPGCGAPAPSGCANNGDVRGDVCGGFGNCCSPWYASFDALYMTRSTPPRTYTSAEPTNNPVNQGYFSDVNWTPGGQGTVGYRFGCGCNWAIQGTYWGLAESSSDGGPGIPGPYVTPMIFGMTDVLGTSGGTGAGGAQQANSWTDSSPCHHIWRTYDAQDVEITLARTVCGGECNGFGVDFLAGFRWFRFQDGFMFGAQRQDDGSAYAGNWLYLDDRITNDLYGGQIGCTASYRFADCWKVFVTPMVGIFDNHMTLDYNLYAQGNGTYYQGSSQTYPNPNYPVHATADGLAFLTQIDVGLDWDICRHVSTQLGYRVMAMTGMGLSDGQIPFYGNDTQSIANIHHDDSLILHGAFAGVTFSW